MNKEVEEAKKWLNKLVKLNKRDNIENSYAEILLNYIQELEESIHKERTLAEAQTTYEVNEMWKQKIKDKINMLKDEITRFYEEEQELGRYDEARLEMLETVEEELLKEE